MDLISGSEEPLLELLFADMVAARLEMSGSDIHRHDVVHVPAGLNLSLPISAFLGVFIETPAEPKTPARPADKFVRLGLGPNTGWTSFYI